MIGNPGSPLVEQDQPETTWYAIATPPFRAYLISARDNPCLFDSIAPLCAMRIS